MGLVKGVFLFVALALFISGCTDPRILRLPVKQEYYVHDVSYETLPISKKNYEIDKEQIAYVGNALIKVAEYDEKRWYEKGLSANKPFKITSLNLNKEIFVPDNEIFFEIGMAPMIEEKHTTAITSKNLAPMALIIEGSFLPFFIEGKRIEGARELFNKIAIDNKVYDATIDKDDVKFEYKKVPSSTIKTEITKQSSYEIIYTGKNDNSITMVYREYTGDDMARPAFSQNLLYSPKQKQIRFKNIIINIISADNEKIVYKVVAD